VKGPWQTADTITRQPHSQVTKTTVAHELTIPADLNAVGFVRSAIVALLSAQGWPGEAVSGALLAGNEAVVNAIEHGSSARDQVSVALALGPDGLELRVRDAGRDGRCPPARPGELPPVEATRGRGLAIMGALSDELELRTARGGGTEARMAFHAPAEARAA